METNNDIECLIKEVLQALEQWSENQEGHNQVIQNMEIEEAAAIIPPKKKKKRVRTIFTPYQLAMLEDEFGRKKYLDRAHRLALADHLRLPDRQVKVWFQNRRMKEKKNTRSERCYTTPVHMPPQEQPNPYVVENHHWYPNYQYGYPQQQQYMPYAPAYNNDQPPQFVDGWGTIQHRQFEPNRFSGHRI